MIDRLGLYHAVFTDPARADMPRPELGTWKAAYDCLAYLADTKTPGSIYQTLVRTDEASYFAWALAAVAPWERLPDPADSGASRKVLPLATRAVREGIKASNKLCDVVREAHRHREEIVKLKEAVCGREAVINERDRWGMAIRAWDASAGHWRLQVLYALLVECLGPPGATDGPPRDEILKGWQQLLDHLEETDLMEAPNLKRLVDGRQLSTALGAKPGKWMTKAMDVAMEWQLRNPGVTDPAGAVEAVRERRDELGIPQA